MVHPLAGTVAPLSMKADVGRMLGAYTDVPDPAVVEQRVSFGTSGHRGSSLKRAFNEAHIMAIVHAVCDYRERAGTNGPLFLGMDTHALSEPAQRTAIEVLAARGVTVRYAAGAEDDARRFTPTPVISHAILRHNRGRTSGLADGIVVTPSHNPPEDGGIKYNPPNGGPADTDATSWIEARANELLVDTRSLSRVPLDRALRTTGIEAHDFVTPYVDDLGNVVDLEEVSRARPHLGVDPLGGSNLGYWGPIAEKYGLDLTVVNRTLDPSFAFMPLDHDGKVRMDCSSPHAMANLVRMKGSFALAFGNDCDSDRHGIVTPGAGLMNPNHYLAVAIEYLFTHRPAWGRDVGIGKTLVSSSMIDRVARAIDRKLVEVPVGFKWFVDGLYRGTLGIGGEESAGASFLRRDGTVWSTDKDGILLDLLAAEILAVTGKDPSVHHAALTARFGAPVYRRIDAPATAKQKAVLKKLAPEAVRAETLAGEKIVARLTRAPGNDASIGGLKVVTENGWFAARPSGTEDVYKIYAESFLGEDHLGRVLDEARAIVDSAFSSA
jgi:phosphoglucomutase